MVGLKEASYLHHLDLDAGKRATLLLRRGHHHVMSNICFCGKKFENTKKNSFKMFLV
jgi:hypothetical protein